MLVVVDRLSKFAHFVALQHPFTIYFVVAQIVKENFCLHGFHSSIVLDKDNIFISIF